MNSKRSGVPSLLDIFYLLESCKAVLYFFFHCSLLSASQASALRNSSSYSLRIVEGLWCSTSGSQFFSNFWSSRVLTVKECSRSLLSGHHCQHRKCRNSKSCAMVCFLDFGCDWRARLWCGKGSCDVAMIVDEGRGGSWVSDWSYCSSFEYSNLTPSAIFIMLASPSICTIDWVAAN